MAVEKRSALAPAASANEAHQAAMGGLCCQAKQQQLEFPF